MGRCFVHWSDTRCRHGIRPTASRALYTITVFYNHREVSYPVTALAAVTAILTVTCPNRQALVKKKKRKKRRSAKVTVVSPQESSLARHSNSCLSVALPPDDCGSDSSDDNWRVFCDSIRAVLAASLSQLVIASLTSTQINEVSDVIPVEVRSNLDDIDEFFSGLKDDSNMRLRANARMSMYECELSSIMERTLQAMRHLVVDSFAAVAEIE